MGSSDLKIPKQPTPVSLRVHPEGIVEGCIFLSLEEADLRPEDPLAVLNHSAPFIVVRRDDPDEIRFYNKSSIVRVHYRSPEPGEGRRDKRLRCVLHMMDGAMLQGSIQRELPPDRARLYDFLNLEAERFLRIHLDEDELCLVNKSYVVRVSEQATS